MHRFRIGRHAPAALFPALMLFVLGLAGCSGPPKPDDSTLSVEVLYNQAVDLMMNQKYASAADKFDSVDRYYPYSVWATKAEVMEIYVDYQANKYDDAITAADHFIALHPGNRDAPYAYYLKAICYYEQITDIGRDQQITLDAQNALQIVIDRYPDSAYAQDARLKLDLTRDHLAGKEMEIGRFYERQGLYIGAINRYRTVIGTYQTTSHVPEALARLVESYTAIGLPREARQTAAVLGYNFPYSTWYRDSYRLIQSTQRDAGGPALAAPGARQEGWFTRTISSIF